MRNFVLRLFALSLLAGASVLAVADDLTVQLFPDALTVPQGGTVTFLGQLTNTTSDPLDLNSIQIQLFEPTITTDTSPFFANFPATLDPVVDNPVTGLLFSLTADLSTPLGNYDGLVEILGIHQGSGDSDVVLGSSAFSVLVAAPPVPEPASMLGVLVGLGILAKRRRN